MDKMGTTEHDTIKWVTSKGPDIYPSDEQTLLLNAVNTNVLVPFILHKNYLSA